MNRGHKIFAHPLPSVSVNWETAPAQMAPQKVLRSRDSRLGEDTKNRRVPLRTTAEPVQNSEKRDCPLRLLCDSIW